jgi:hypothetical protein
MSGRRPLRWRRSVHRAVHLVPAAVLGVFLYSPLRTDPSAVLLVQAVVFPVLVLSGLLLWRGGRLRRWLATRGSS